MKKTVALVLMAIFVFSLVPLSFADNSGPGSIRDKIEDIKDTREDVKDLQEDLRDKINIDRERCIEKCQNESNNNCEARCKVADIKENVRDRNENIRDVKEDLRERLREGKSIKVRTAADLNIRHIKVEKLEELRERYEDVKEKYKEAKEDMHDARERLKHSLQDGNQTGAFEHAKTYLLRSADALINHLEKLKTKVQENENIPDDREAEIVAEIDVQISAINDIKVEIEAATTREQIKDAAKKLRDVWKKLKHIIKFHTQRIVAARVEGIVNNGLVLEKRLDKILANLNESTDVDVEVDNFKAKINLSRDKYRQAQDKLEEVLDLRAAGESADSEKIKALMEEAGQLLKEARDALKEAHEILKSIVKKIKEEAPDADLSEDVEVEVEHEAEVEDEDDEGATEAEANTTVEVNATT